MLILVVLRQILQICWQFISTLYIYMYCRFILIFQEDLTVVKIFQKVLGGATFLKHPVYRQTPDILTFIFITYEIYSVSRKKRPPKIKVKVWALAIAYSATYMSQTRAAIYTYNTEQKSLKITENTHRWCQFGGSGSGSATGELGHYGSHPHPQVADIGERPREWTRG